MAILTYIAGDGEEREIESIADLTRMVQSGELTRGMLGKLPGETRWRALGDILPAFSQEESNRQANATPALSSEASIPEPDRQRARANPETTIHAPRPTASNSDTASSGPNGSYMSELAIRLKASSSILVPERMKTWFGFAEGALIAGFFGLIIVALQASFELFLVVSVGSSVLLAIGSILLVMTVWMACSEMNDVDPEESRRGWLLLFFFLPGPWQALAVWRLLQLRNGYHRVYERLSLEKKAENLGFDFPRIGEPQFVLMVGLGVVFGTYTLAVRLTPNLLFEQIIAATHGWILVVDGMGLLFYIWLADRTLHARDWFSKLMRTVRSEHAGESS